MAPVVKDISHQGLKSLVERLESGYLLSGYFWQHSGVSKITLSSFLIQDVAGLAQKIKKCMLHRSQKDCLSFSSGLTVVAMCKMRVGHKESSESLHVQTFDT